MKKKRQRSFKKKKGKKEGKEKVEKRRDIKKRIGKSLFNSEKNGNGRTKNGF